MQQVTVGQRFGDWTVIGLAYRHTLQCLCDCGRKSLVGRRHLLSGHSVRCGHCRKGSPRIERSLWLVLDFAAKELGYPLADLLSPSRETPLAQDRQFAMWLARQTTSASLPAIGRVFGRHHATVLHGIRITEARIQKDAATKRSAEWLLARLRAQSWLTQEGMSEAA